MWAESLVEAKRAQQQWIRRNAIFLAGYAWKHIGRKGGRGAIKIRELADHERAGQADADLEIDVVAANKIPGQIAKLRTVVDSYNPKQEFVVYFTWRIQGEELRSFERITATPDGFIPRPPDVPLSDGVQRRNVSRWAELNPKAVRGSG
jgi:hypothetical protein